jgi:hypothetical protein
VVGLLLFLLDEDKEQASQDSRRVFPKKNRTHQGNGGPVYHFLLSDIEQNVSSATTHS